MIPEQGALVLSVPGISGVSVGAGLTGDLVPFMWPQTYRIAGFQLTTRDGLVTSLAGVRLRMLDDDSNELLVDGQARTASAPGLALTGLTSFFSLIGGGRMTLFQRIVRVRDRWRFQIINDNAIDVVPELTFRFGRLVQ